jgi:hypothetical protein
MFGTTYCSTELVVVFGMLAGKKETFNSTINYLNFVESLRGKHYSIEV